MVDETLTFITPDGANICTPFRPDLSTLIPHARTLEWQGKRMLVIPNGHEEAKLARNVGLHIPSPILTRYRWPGATPWEIQRITAAMLTESPRAYVLSTMGTGKTRAALYACDYLLETKRIKRVLIVAPLSTLTPVWEAELFRTLPLRRAIVVYGPREKRLKLLATDAEFFIMNFHGVTMLEAAIVTKHFDVMIIDELAILRNKGTALWKAHNSVASKLRFVWGMTGSPTPMAPTDAWAQIRLLTPTRTSRSMAQFQDITMRRLSQFRWVARPEANDIVHQQMQPSVRFTRDDIAELPPTSYVEREVKLEPLAAKAYKMLFDKMRTATDGGASITAANEGILQSKLLQVACGYIYTDKKEIYELPNGPRRTALTDTIAETDRKVIVFVPFVHALEGVAAHLRSQGMDVGLVHGGVSRAKRDFIFRGFQDGKSPQVVVAHPQCMAHGLTLTAANTIIWYCPTSSLEVYEQANARIIRPGQTAKTFIVHLTGTPVERVTYARLKARGKMQGMLLAMFRDQELLY